MPLLWALHKHSSVTGLTKFASSLPQVVEGIEDDSPELLVSFPRRRMHAPLAVNPSSHAEARAVLAGR